MKAMDFIYMGLAGVCIVLGFIMTITGQGWASLGMIAVGITLMARTILS